MAQYSACDVGSGACDSDASPRKSLKLGRARAKTSASVYQLSDEALTPADIREVVAQYGAQGESAGDAVASHRHVSLFRRLLSALRGKQKPSSHTPLIAALRSLLIFVGTPAFTAGEALLFDTRRAPDAARLQSDVVLRRLELMLLTEMPDLDALDPDLALRFYLGDLTTPCIEISLADLLRRKGVCLVDRMRSLNETVRIVLVDPANVWQQEAPFLELRLAW